MTQTILTLTLSYGLVAVIAVLLVVSGQYPRLLKGVLACAVAVLLFTTYRGIGELRGLPSDARPPDSFRLYWAQITEPNPLQRDKGAIFLWLSELDADNYPVGLPRAHKLPYSEELALEVGEAQRQISLGEEIAGTFEEGDDDPSPLDAAFLEPNDGAQGGSELGEAQIFMDLGDLSFGIAPAPKTPQKQN